MIEIGSRKNTLPAPPEVVWQSLVEPRRPGARPWLVLVDDEVDPRVIGGARPHVVVWTSLWPERRHDEIHFDLDSDGDGGTRLRWQLLTPDEAPDEDTRRHLRQRLDHLLFADLRFSYGQ